MFALDLEAAAAEGDAVEIDRRGEAAGMPEDHIGRSGTGIAAVVEDGADDYVGDAVPIDVAGVRHRETCAITRVLALDLEATGPQGDAVEVDRGGEAARVPEHHIGGPSKRAATAIEGCPDDQVGDAVAVHVARCRHREAGLVAGTLAPNLEAACASGDVVEVNHGR